MTRKELDLWFENRIEETIGLLAFVEDLLPISEGFAALERDPTGDADEREERRRQLETQRRILSENGPSDAAMRVARDLVARRKLQGEKRKAKNR
ncbi:MAG: hypothetical protein FJ144_02780 [Deltaproteobacteria bacterium]|nr:hypothetical protein [Deltaproteobacteria bacterium]